MIEGVRLFLRWDLYQRTLPFPVFLFRVDIPQSIPVQFPLVWGHQEETLLGDPDRVQVPHENLSGRLSSCQLRNPVTLFFPYRGLVRAQV